MKADEILFPVPFVSCNTTFGSHDRPMLLLSGGSRRVTGSAIIQYPDKAKPVERLTAWGPGVRLRAPMGSRGKAPDGSPEGSAAPPEALGL